jgi:hypothetical protein
MGLKNTKKQPVWTVSCVTANLLFAVDIWLFSRLYREDRLYSQSVYIWLQYFKHNFLVRSAEKGSFCGIDRQKPKD